MVVKGRLESGGADAGCGGVDVAGEAVPAPGIQAQTVSAAAGVRAPSVGPGVGQRRQRGAGRVDDRRVDEDGEGCVEGGERRCEGIVVSER
jgi:hypothetical protein